MDDKPWEEICSRSCWIATQDRCRCRCKGRHHGNARQSRLEDLIPVLEEEEIPAEG
jgi:hypothetical protein